MAPSIPSSSDPPSAPTPVDPRRERLRRQDDSLENPFASGTSSRTSTISNDSKQDSSPTTQAFPREQTLNHSFHQPVYPGDLTPRPENLGNDQGSQRTSETQRHIEIHGRKAGVSTSGDECNGTTQQAVCDTVKVEAKKSTGPEKWKDAWTPQAVLSFDGGGIRGYASLLLLQKLMAEVAKLEREHETERHFTSFQYFRPRKTSENSPDSTESKDVEPTSMNPQACDATATDQGTRKGSMSDPEHDRKTVGRRDASEVRKNRSQSSRTAGSIGAETTRPTRKVTTTSNAMSQEKIPFKDVYLPCHYFDFIAGTSTGGLIAIMLGRFRMTVEDCLQQYERFGREIFGSSRVSAGGLFQDRHSSKPLEAALKRLTMEKTPESRRELSGGGREPRMKRTLTGRRKRPDTLEDIGNPSKSTPSKAESSSPANERPYTESRFTRFRIKPGVCQVMVLALRLPPNGGQFLHIFRTYKPSIIPEKEHTDFIHNPDAVSHRQIFEVGRATSAAPTYFKPMTIDGDEYLDGAVEANNPSRELFHEVKSIKECPPNVAHPFRVFVSIGTGKPPRESLSWQKASKLLRPFKKATRIGRYAIKSLTEAERTHEQMERENLDCYFRFNEHSGYLGMVALNEWKKREIGKDNKGDTLVYIRECVDREVGREEFQANIQKCAKLLVEHRRQRACAWNRAAASRWERFSECVRFKCKKCNTYHYTRASICKHIDEEHREAWPTTPWDEEQQSWEEFNRAFRAGPLIDNDGYFFGAF